MQFNSGAGFVEWGCHKELYVNKYGDVKRALVVTHLILLIQFHRIR